MKILVIAFLIFGSVFEARAEFRPCIDTLASPKYCGALRAIPNHFAVSCFARTFGDCLPCATREMRAGRSYMRINLMWSDTHSYGDSDIRTLRKEAARFDALCAEFPGRIELAPFTEHAIAKPDKYLEIVKVAAPHCGKPVNSAWRGGLTKNPAYKNEVHGDHASPKISGVAWNYSHDGTNSVDENFTATKRSRSDAEILCAWGPRLNGKCSMKDGRARADRDCWADKKYLRSLVALFSEKGKTD